MTAPDAREGEHDGGLYARTIGSGPPIVLIHGLVGSSRYWGPPFEALANTHQVVIPDLLGFGRSPKPPVGYRPDDHVDALLSTLDRVGAIAPAVIGAHSAGSVIALRLALRRPDRVRAVVSFGPPLYPDTASARARLGAMGPMARLFALPGSVAAAACAWVCDHRDLASRLAVLTHPHLPRDVAADSVAHTWASYTGTLTEVVLAANAADWLVDIQASVTLVAGRSDRVVDHAFLQQLASAPGVRYDEWPGDHHLPLRAAERCVHLLRSAADES